MLNIKRLIYTDIGRAIMSILLGLGLSTLFRKVCKKRSCLVFKAAPLNKIKNQIFRFNKKCYKFNPTIQKCDKSKKIVPFA
jgi:hypothetical protein